MNEIYLSGTIGQSFWDEEFFTEASVREVLEGLTGPLTVNLNSGGGIATEGQAIYTLLKDYPGAVTVVVNGIAASAASLIAMAGDHIIMPEGAIMMIHDPASWAVEGRGTEADHLKAAKHLGVIANAYAAIYAARAGISPEAARKIMQVETYYDGPQAVRAGFATATDDSAAAAAAALFDYNLYAYAPASLRAVGDAVGRRQSKRAVAAMMAGSNNAQKEAFMPKPRATRANATMNDDQAPTLEDDLDPALDDQNLDDITASDDADITASDDDEITADDGDDLDDLNASGADPDDELKTAMRATAVMKLCKARGISTAVAHHYIAAGMSSDDVRRLHPSNKDGRMPQTTAFTPRARIVRDEVDTRRAALTGAIFAKMQQKRGRKVEVQGASRQYMDAGLIEMASVATGRKLPRFAMSYGVREQFMMDAMHSTSDFPAIFQNALHKVLLDTYSNFTPTYQRVAERKDFNDFRPMPLVMTGSLPMLKPITETGEIKHGTFSDRGEMATIERYGVIVPIDRAMIVNDELGAIARVMERYGRTVGVFEERTFYSLAFSGLMSDEKPIFHTDHKNVAPNGSDITDDAVSEARTYLREAKGLDGEPLYLNPNLLLVGPKNETAAQRLLAQTTPANADDVNVFSGQLGLVVTPEITGREWYVFDDTNPCWTYGYLEDASAPRVSTQELFDQQGMKLKLEHDFGVGHARYESGFKNIGR
ncbi:head maturation protease, ClpP-related [Ketogulonicigenium vulgare]|uniref:head maturation protease, ClpP-related n=1 Tax=Ketogulonicigenium vulgare TaxID=92945 RepID=UPI002358BAE8|nr:head maturation protease, ClpP-related [Ketogulonicigenium vulgare]